MDSSDLPMLRVVLPIVLGVGLACGGVDLPVENPDPREPVEQAASASEEKEASKPLPAVDFEALILWGSQQKNDTAKWLKERSPALGAMKDGFSDGFPKQVESDSIKGLKPGFHVVLGGYCTPGSGDSALQKLKPHFEGASIRTVQIPGGEPSCPDFSRLPAAKTGLRLVAEGAECNVVRMDLSTGEESKKLGSMTGACPESWSWTGAFSPDRSRLLVADEAVWLLDIKASSSKLLPQLPGLEVAVWEGEAPVAWAIVDAKYEANEETAEGWFWYRDEQFFVADYEMAMMTQPMLCEQSILKDGEWDSREVVGIAPGEGTSPPFCFSGDGDFVQIHSSGHGDFYEQVPFERIEEMGPLAKGSGSREWSWVEGSADGGVAMASEWLEGTIFTGGALAYDGETWREFKGLEGRASEQLPLLDGGIYLCTDKGFGVFNPRTGAQRYWHQGSCLAIE
jgi:hypothetical protein